MEKLSVEKRTEVSKMSTERLRAKLTKAGYDEDEVFEWAYRTPGTTIAPIQPTTKQTAIGLQDSRHYASTNPTYHSFSNCY